MSKKILVVEDDADIASIEVDFLEIEGYQVTALADGLEGYQAALSNQFQLILLDLMLPGMSGFEICKQIRDKVDVPIIMVTAKTEEIDKLRGLGLGADDYIAKPFSPTELVARVKANLAQYDRIKAHVEGPAVTESQDTIKKGPITINPKTHRVFVNEQEVGLKHREYELLLFLMENAEMVFSKEELYEKIWGFDAIGDLRTVAVHINRLREKIEKDPSNPQHLQTVWGAGYRFAP
ncbi:response regulator transcription factor [Enterococcus sp. LJL120]